MIHDVVAQKSSSAFAGFLDFIREQGVMGLALGFILGTAVSKVVTSFSDDIINPILTLLFGSTERLESLHIGPIMIGDFTSNVINFLIIAATVYLLFRLLRLNKLDIRKL